MVKAMAKPLSPTRGGAQRRSLRWRRSARNPITQVAKANPRSWLVPATTICSGPAARILLNPLATLPYLAKAQSAMTVPLAPMPSSMKATVHPIAFQGDTLAGPLSAGVN